jgi:probable F420-dependent oxidoreductase
MKFALAFANTGPFSNPDKAFAMAQAAEAAGFESLWTVEHVVVPSNYDSPYPYDASGKMPGGEESPIPDPLIWLSFVAAATQSIKLATGILILPQRNPVVLAKELSTLDHLSKGRMLLGIGVGWLEEEFDALGIPFADRGKRNDDYVAAMRSLWTQERATPSPSMEPSPFILAGTPTLPHDVLVVWAMASFQVKVHMSSWRVHLTSFVIPLGNVDVIPMRSK